MALANLLTVDTRSATQEEILDNKYYPGAIGVSRLFGVHAATARRWITGRRRIPRHVVATMTMLSLIKDSSFLQEIADVLEAQRFLASTKKRRKKKAKDD